MHLKPFKISNLINAEIGTEEEFSIREKVSDIHEDDPQIIAPVAVEVIFLKMKDRINADFNELSTSIALQCGRCLTPIEHTVEIPFFAASYLLKPQENSEEERADNFTVDVKYNVIDISEAVRDEVLLTSPAFPLCKEDCKGLCLVCGVNWNEKECEHEKLKNAPKDSSPFASLKTLVENSKKVPGKKKLIDNAGT